MKSWLWLVLLVPSAQACELPGGPSETLQAPHHTIVYRAAPGLRAGAHFALEVAVCPPPQRLQVDAWMPAHRHGMNYRPSIEHLGGGRYRAEGLMFHMPGRWEFLFELHAGGETERVARPVDVE